MPQPLDVRAHVFGIFDAGEVVVRGQVHHRVGTALFGDPREDRLELAPIADVGLEPHDLGMLRRAGPLLRPPRNAVEARRARQRRQQVAPDESRRARDDHPA